MARKSSTSDVQGLVTRLMQTDFVAAHALWVEGHLRVLTGLRRPFGNDMDKIIVLAIIGQQMLTDPALADLPPNGHDTALPPVDINRLTNIDSISRATGIPRESVRRKVNELIEAGWVDRVSPKRLSVNIKAATDLAPITLDNIAMLDALFGRYLAMMIRKGWINVVPVAEDDRPPG